MKNTVTVERKIIGRLKITTLVLFIFCCLCILMLVCAKMIDKQNLSGNVSEVTGILTKAEDVDGQTHLFVKSDDNNSEGEYNVVFDNEIDFTKYINKTVTVIIPQQTFGWSNPWALGLKYNDQTIVDYSVTLEDHVKENDDVILVSSILTGILAAATLATFIWRVNINPAAEKPLDKQFAEYAYSRQPTCPERKTLVIVTLVYVLIILLLCIITPIVASTEPETDQMTAADITLITVGCVVTVGGAIAVLILSAVTFKKEIDFYAEKFPFDFTDISHERMRKDVKAELQKQIKAERELNPHVFGEGGNGYDVEFTPEGVNLYVDYNYSETAASSEISEVFPDMPKESTPFDDTPTSANKPCLSLSYGELNFEAKAFYRRRSHPMLVIVKSRLNRRDDFPEEFANDLHFILDSNLLATLKTFDVQVDNLDFILENKKQLMMDNCFKNKIKKQ